MLPRLLIEQQLAVLGHPQAIQLAFVLDNQFRFTTRDL